MAPRRIELLVIAVLVSLYWAGTSAASTVIPGSTHITTNTEWTTAGSPYVITNYLTVNSGVTLTVDPGVVVKFEQSNFGEIDVDGSLVADGTSEAPITFTSYADDSVGGDTNGDGSSSGSPGDWYSILFLGSGTGDLDHVNVTYGGWGSPAYAYGAVQTQDSASLTVNHSLFTQNEAAGVKGGPSSTVSISASEFSNNGDGISAINTSLTIDSGTDVHDNNTDGLFINESYWSGAAPSITDSSFEDNGHDGVKLWIDAPSSTLPVAHYNNIDGNSNLQLEALEDLVGSDWTYNYWGDTVTYIPCTLLLGCPTPGSHEPYYLANTSSWDDLYWVYPASPPPSVVSSTLDQWVVDVDDVNEVWQTRLDWIHDYPASSSPY